MEDLASIGTNLSLNDEGIWVAGEQSIVSYPEEGNEQCFELEETSFWFNHRNEVIQYLLKIYPPGGTLFDIGGGNGFVTMALQRSGIDAVVVEPGPQGARNAKRRGVRAVVQSTLEEIGFQPNTVSAFGLFDVLEHIEGDVDFLKSLNGYMIPGGQLYLTVPALQFLWSVEDDYAGHFRRYTDRNLTSTLKLAGFSVPYVSYFFGILMPAVFLLRAIPSRLGSRRSGSMDTARREHATNKGLTGAVLTYCLHHELKRIMRGKRVPTGSSCIAVARKVR